MYTLIIIALFVVILILYQLNSMLAEIKTNQVKVMCDIEELNEKIDMLAGDIQELYNWTYVGHMKNEENELLQITLKSLNKDR